MLPPAGGDERSADAVVAAAATDSSLRPVASEEVCRRGGAGVTAERLRLRRRRNAGRDGVDARLPPSALAPMAAAPRAGVTDVVRNVSPRTVGPPSALASSSSQLRSLPLSPSPSSSAPLSPRGSSSSWSAAAARTPAASTIVRLRPERRNMGKAGEWAVEVADGGRLMAVVDEEPQRSRRGGG